MVVFLGLDDREGLDEVGEVGQITRLLGQGDAFLDAPAGEFVIGEREGRLGKVVEGNIRREPVASAAGKVEASFDLRYGGSGLTTE